ncbi:MAG: hypothetical protein JWO98_5505 [Frankiales bacterium]|nr:hypothetical protein [Frankiales bacterium]
MQPSRNFPGPDGARGPEASTADLTIRRAGLERHVMVLVADDGHHLRVGHRLGLVRRRARRSVGTTVLGRGPRRSVDGRDFRGRCSSRRLQCAPHLRPDRLATPCRAAAFRRCADPLHHCFGRGLLPSLIKTLTAATVNLPDRASLDRDGVNSHQLSAISRGRMDPSHPPARRPAPDVLGVSQRQRECIDGSSAGSGLAMTDRAPTADWPGPIRDRFTRVSSPPHLVRWYSE